MKNSHEGVTWPEVGKQNVRAKEVYCHALRLQYPSDEASESAMRTSINSTAFRLFRRFSGTQTAVCTRALFFHTVCYILRFCPTHPPWRAGDCKDKCFHCEHRETGNSFILGLIAQLVEHYHGISEVRVRVPLGLHFLGLSHYCLSCAKKTLQG